MEINKTLILHLIQADLKHNQLINALESIHLDTDGVYYINLADAVAKLMGMDGEKSDQWFAIYDSYMEQAHSHAVEDRGSNLAPIAQDCYSHLLACMQIEAKLREAGELRQGNG